MIIKRAKENPVLKPVSFHAWEGEGVFNGCPVLKGNKIFLFYRAVSVPHYHSAVRKDILTSDIGIAESKDGIHFEKRKRFIVAEKEWEKFGCEDPRVTRLDKKYYIFYTALSTYPPRAEGIRVGLAISKDLKKIQQKFLVTPFNAKAMTLFPERIKGKIWGILTVHTDIPPAKICLVSFNEEKEIFSHNFWEKWYSRFEKYSLPLQRRPQDHIEIGSQPLKTRKGWLLLYCYIQNYFSPHPLFTVEAFLLDLKNPLKLLAKFNYPILSPQEYYEKIGKVPDVIFPSGAFIKRGWIYLYYGACDTTCCLAYIKLSSLLEEMLLEKEKRITLVKFSGNPIITPIKEHPFESKATFNPAAIYLQGRVHIIYRAIGEDNTSVLGYGNSKNGFHIDYRSPHPIYVPRAPFEKKPHPGASSGCEDPRITKIGNKIYLLYTAFDGYTPRVALSWIYVKDFLRKKWQNFAFPVLLSPADLNDKNAFLFPEKVRNKYLLVHRVGYDIDYSFTSTLKFKKEVFLEEKRWIFTRRGWWDSGKIGGAAPPIKTREGWIMLYHGFSEEEKIYRVGAVLLDFENPLKVLARTRFPILEPEFPFEKEGLVPNVVFPCGNVLINDKLFVYYGGGDKVVCVATIEIEKLLKLLKKSPIVEFK